MQFCGKVMLARAEKASRADAVRCGWGWGGEFCRGSIGANAVVAGLGEGERAVFDEGGEKKGRDLFPMEDAARGTGSATPGASYSRGDSLEIPGKRGRDVQGSKERKKWHNEHGSRGVLEARLVDHVYRDGVSK